MARVSTSNLNQCIVCRDSTCIALFPVVDHESGETFDLLKCVDCGLIWVSNPPPSERLWEYYGAVMGQSMHREPGPVFRRLRRIRIRHDVKGLVADLDSDARIIDFGTGDGSLANELLSMGFRVAARDTYSAESWKRARIEYLQIDVAQPSPSELMVEGKIADAIVMRHVLEHTPDPRRLLETMRNAGVKRVLVIVPNAQSRFAAMLGPDWYYWDPPRHLFHFGPQSLSRLVESCSSRLERLEVYGIDELVSSQNRRLRNKVLPRREHSRLQRFLLKITHPTGILAGLSSGLSGFVSKGVIRAQINLQQDSDS